MKAMILAAGLGQRMRPLTDHLPKPLLTANGKTLLDYHLEKIQQAGVHEVIINLAYLGEKIREHLQQHPYPQLKIIFSQEPEPLETGGALLHAATLLGDEDFLLVNGDVWSDMDYQQLIKRKLKPNQLGHLVLVENPDFHPQGDFILDSNTELLEEKQQQQGFTFSGISILSPQLIEHYSRKRIKFPLVEAFREAIIHKKLTGELYCGHWSDVGTPQRLNDLDNLLRSLNS
jgi:N-acetyl-alpha-D-muramate 1-phosphate uridylyltransferase